MKKRTLVTSALPYANGPIHIGHLVEYIQTDIYVRFLRLIGEDAIYCCADDAHGTAIEMSAAKAGIAPEELIAGVREEHLRDFTDCHIRFDSYHTTHSPENQYFANRIFNALSDNGDISTRDVERTYCSSCARFLPDRYVKGTCPKCGAVDQYGDVCEKCNAAYNTTDLVGAYCTICGNAPELRTSKHYFFKLANYTEFLREWLENADWLQPEIGNYLMNWIKDGLMDWEISRDGPYFGFKIPGEEDKFFYVWLDAPIGYIASTKHWCDQRGRSFEEYWESDESKIVHFIGKDIIYFHFLFWPAMLHGAGLRVPDQLCVHGFLTVNGEKMSKSRGTFLTARHFLEHFDPEHLRFYYAKLIGNRVSDVDLNFDEFKNAVNSGLAANVGNFANRTLKFLEKNFAGEIKGVCEEDSEIKAQILEELAAARKEYEAVNLAGAVRRILAASSMGNKYFQDAAPWALIKTDRDAAHKKVGLAVNVIRNLAVALSPIVPNLASDLAGRLGVEIQSWDQIGFDLIQGMVQEGAVPVSPIDEIPSFAAAPEPEIAAEIIFEPELRVARIEQVEDHPGADRLYVLQIDLGVEKRQIVAGVRQRIEKEDLLGKKIVVVANLAPANLRGVESNGMFLAASAKDKITPLTTEAPVGALALPIGTSMGTRQIDITTFGQYPLDVEGGKIKWNGKPLTADLFDVTADIDDGAKVK